jgi:predicted lipase
MGLFDKKTEAEKQRKQDEREIRKEAREDRREARQDAREDRKEIRQEARDDKKEERHEARAERKEARQEKRDDMREIRQSDLHGEAKRDAKSDVRDDKRDAVRESREDKRDTIEDIRGEKRADIDTVNDAKKTAVESTKLTEIEALAALSPQGTHRFDEALAIELLALTHTAQFETPATLESSDIVTSDLLSKAADCTLRGAPVKNAVAISRETFKSDTECFVARSRDDDVVVAFRGSETQFFDQVGAFRDWVLTDFRATRVPYPPAPGKWPNQRWVHSGFWQAYELVRPRLLAEVSAQAMRRGTARRIYVTGFSLGGALALLAALDIAEGVRDVPVELCTFAAPRAGDGSLNKLLAERLAKSTLVAFRGDPVVHLPPLGPNFPVTFRNPVHLELAGIEIGLGTPLPQVGQQYRTADHLVYIDNDGSVRNRFPTGQVALNFLDHDWPPYLAALKGIAAAATV